MGLRTNNKLISKIALGIIPATLIFFYATSPQNGNSIVIIVGALLLAMSIYVAYWSITRQVVKYRIFSQAQARRLSRVAWLFTIFAIFMQSIGQLSVRDLLAAIPFAGVFYLYLAYSETRKDGDKALGKY